MDIQLADVTLHIDENLDKDHRNEVETNLRRVDGVVSVHNPDEHPHLTVVAYNPQRTESQELLGQMKALGVHAKLIGF